MSSAHDPAIPTTTPIRKPPSGELPPVEPPTMGFILQLFVIPMVIVSIIVAIWLLFNWLAHMGTNPTDLVDDLKKLNDVSWQKALTLADLLRNPQYAHLKKDPALAKELATVLNGQIAAADMKESPVRLRTFLCRALGEFESPEALPALLRAVKTDRDPAELETRMGALQAIAVYVSHNPAASLRDDAELLKTVLDASRETTDNVEQKNARGDIRAHAAFVLGMLGGTAALDRLHVMQGDAYPNARFNATTGLCRHGDPRALEGLAEMIDPESDSGVASETKDEAKPFKRLSVIQNGLRAAEQLVEKNRDADLAALTKLLQAVLDSKLEKFAPGTRRGIRIEAEEVAIRLQNRNKTK